MFCANGNITNYDQDNHPDYLGYYLNLDFENWYKNQHQKVVLENISDLSISTDGIFTFAEFDNNKYEETNEDALISFLLINTEWIAYKNMLDKKLMEIERRYGLKPNDDLSIVRIIF